MMKRVLRCYAEGHDNEWEAICLDLDVSVQGRSFNEVFTELPKACQLYLDTVNELPAEDRARLLNRRAPLSIRMKFALNAIRTLFRDSDNDDFHHQFTMPCTA